MLIVFYRTEFTPTSGLKYEGNLNLQNVLYKNYIVYVLNNFSYYVETSVAFKHVQQ